MKTRLLVLPLVMAATAAMPCLVSVTEGVHFKGPAIDFGQPPARTKMYATSYDSGSAWRPGTNYEFGGQYTYDEDEEGRKEKKRIRLLKQSWNAENDGRLGDARRIYRSFGAAGGFVAGRLELLSTPGISQAKGLGRLLRATHPLSKSTLPKESEVAPVLRPWVAYSLAWLPPQYLAVAQRFPASSRAPSALIMTGRLLSQKDRPTLTDLQGADRAFRLLLVRYPESRFAWDARGGLARVDYLRGRFDQAVKRYEEQARTAANLNQKTIALSSISLCARFARNYPAQSFTYLRLYEAHLDGWPFPYEAMMSQTLGRFSGDDARAFWGRLRRDPSRLATYVEWRATNGRSTTDLVGLADPALKLAAGSPAEGRIAGSLARVALEHGDLKKASRYAHIALRASGGDERALGTYVLATVDRRAGRFRAAQTGYRSLISNYPHSYLAGGARESLAIVSERLGDFSGAMDQYLRLGYEEDVSYLSDIRMEPAELATYVRAHPEKDDLRYTLAMRYLRKGQWDSAEETLRPFSKGKRKKLSQDDLGEWNIQRDGKPQDPLKTVRDLRRLDRAVQRAKGPAAKASALSAMADYYLAHKCLLLYSAPAWKGSRDMTISFSWNSVVATLKDDSALRVHFDEHECYSQALKRYREVVKKYPRTPIAGHAAYWGAVAAERLSNMAPYWRWREREDDRQGEAVRLLAFAQKSQDPRIVKRAKKYGAVFARERSASRTAFADEKAPSRRWKPE